MRSTAAYVGVAVVADPPKLPPKDHPGVDLLIARARDQQAAGNMALREALEAVLTQDLRGRLEELARP